MRRKTQWIAVIALAACTASAQQPAPPTAPVPTSIGNTAQKHPASRRDKEQAEKLFLEGAKDLEQNNLQAAMDAFSRAAALNPAEQKYAFSAEIARQHIVTQLIHDADKAKIQGHMTEARQKIQQAFRLDPGNPMLAQHLGELASTTAAGEPALRSEMAAAPIQLQPKPGRFSFHLRASSRTIIPEVLARYGVQATLDDTVEPRTIRYDLDDVDFAAAEQALGLATNTFFVPLDPARVLVARDNLTNHEKFERLATETLYLPGMTGNEATDELAQMVNIAKQFFGARTAISDAGAHTLTIRGPAANLPGLNATLRNLLDARGEIQLDVSMYEVDRTKATDLGVLLPTQTTLFNVYSQAASLLQSNSGLVQQIISSGLAAPGDWEAILAILVASGQISNSIFSQPFAVFGGGISMTGLSFGGGTLNMQLNSTAVHAVDSIEIRAMDRQEATIKSGERYPIITSSYSSLSPTSLSIPGLSTPGLSSTLQNLGINPAALASAASQVIPQVQYQDIGLSLNVTPQLQGPERISLKFDLKLSSLAGASLNDLPVLNNREFKAITSLKMGESAVIVSELSRQESVAITGIPGLSEIPGFQDATNNNTNLDYGRLAVVITPHLVHSLPHQATEEMVLLPR